MKNKPVIHIFLVSLLCVVVNKSYSQRLFGIDYIYVAEQTPTSPDFDLSGERIAFSNFNADISYGGYLDKKNENSLVLFTLDYSSLKTIVNFDDSDEQRIKSDVPEHYHSLPTINEVGLSVFYSYSFLESYSLNANAYVNMTPNNKGLFNKKNYNSSGLLYLQKRYKNVELGLGASVYLLENRIRAFPVGYIRYAGEKLTMDIMPPLSADISYNIYNKFSIIGEAELDFGGFNVEYNQSDTTITKMPDYVSNTDVRFETGIDYNFYGNLHIDLTVGFLYREMDFVLKEKEIGSVKLQDGLMVRVGFYCSF